MTRLVTQTLASNGRPTRTLHHQRPEDGHAEAVCVMLDAEYYLRGDAPRLLADEQRAGRLPPLHVTYVSAVDASTRWTESLCSIAFGDFVANDVCAAAREAASAPTAPVVLGGLSLTGLAVVHAGLRHPATFHAVIAQSSSAWWNDEWIVAEVMRATPPGPTFRLVCGDQETTAPVTHEPPEGHEALVQRTSQLQANRRLRDALRDGGFTVSWHEFSGGHGLDCWIADLAASLRSTLRPETD